MKLIIDIDERAYKGSLQLKTDDDMGFLAGHLINATANGTSLIEELEKIKEEIQGLIDFEESCCGNATLGYECLGVINDKLSELKGDKCDNDHDCEHCDWVECPLDKENKE